MNRQPLNLADLDSELSTTGLQRENLLNEVTEQVRKDFSSRVSIDLRSNDLQSLVDAVINALDNYANGWDIHSIMQVAYRVDIKEEMLHRAMMNPDRKVAMEQVAVLIIFRCLQKVLTRKMYG